MLSFIKDIFSENNENNQDLRKQKRLQIATTALFIEIAKADNSFTSVERNHVIESIKIFFSINDEQAHELIDLAEDRIVKSVSLYEFTDILNQEFDQDEKYELAKKMWQIVFADNVLNKYEEYIMRIISNNLKLSHREMIAAKTEAKNSS